MRPFVPKLSSGAFFEEAVDEFNAADFLAVATEATVGAGAGADLIHAALEAVVGSGTMGTIGGGAAAPPHAVLPPVAAMLAQPPPER